MSEYEYVVKYKHINQYFWRQIKNVISDGIASPESTTHTFRYFITIDGQRIEIPMEGMQFKFGVERMKTVEENFVANSKEKQKTNETKGGQNKATIQ